MKSKYIIFVGMGLELVGIILVTLFVGQALDQKFQTKGLIMIGLSLLGLCGWLIQLVTLAKRLDKNDTSEP